MQNLDLHALTGWDALVASFNNALNQVIVLAPKVVGMVLVLVVGYLVARLLDKFVAALAHSLGLEKAAERSGLSASMHQAGVDRSVPWILGRIVFWITMCVFFSAAFSIVGLETVSIGMQKILAYIPDVLVATVVVVVGLLVATFVRGVIATSADRVGISYADNLANACYYVIALMTFIGAFDQLGIQFGLLKELILIAFGAVALGFGLAFGLGGREVMAGILAGYYTRQRLQTGDYVVIGNMSGTVREVGPTATVIETQEDGLINRHSIPNIKMLNEAVR